MILEGSEAFMVVFGMIVLMIVGGFFAFCAVCLIISEHLELKRTKKPEPDGYSEDNKVKWK